MKALVVVDMQNDFITGSLGTPEAQLILPSVAKRIRRARAEGEWIVFTADTHHADYAETQEGRRLPVAHCVQGTEGWELCAAVKEAYGEGELPLFCKGTFGSVELARHLAERGCTEVEFLGLCTDICVISNAMLCKAFLPEARIVVNSAGCAGVTPESHRNALDAMRMCQIDVI